MPGRPENANQREMREIVQALAILKLPLGELQSRAVQAVKNSKLSKDEKLENARKASIVSRQEQTRKDRLMLRNIIREIQKRDPGLSYAHIDIELRKRGINPLRASHWTYRTLKAIVNP